MIFRNRREAGRLLAHKLMEYRDAPDTILLALPRGGVPVAFEVASSLSLSLDVTCPHKLGAPGNPELAIGAITENGEGLYSKELIRRLNVSDHYLRGEVERQRALAAEKVARYHGNRPPPEILGKRVIIVDDGLATGSTMKAAVISVRRAGARYIVVAVPVTPSDTLSEMEELVDRVVALSVPARFAAVGQFYGDFEQVSDEEVISLLEATSRCS